MGLNTWVIAYSVPNALRHFSFDYQYLTKPCHDCVGNSDQYCDVSPGKFRRASIAIRTSSLAVDRYH